MKNAPVKAKITSENIHISRKMLYLCARKEPIELFLRKYGHHSNYRFGRQVGYCVSQQ